MRIVCYTILAACLTWPALAFAQVAEGAYPGTLLCSADAAGGGSIRAPITVEIAGGRATYTFRTAAGVETGTGTLTGRQLQLTGRATGRGSYDARYAGEVSGRGGLLTGTQTGKGVRRGCQISIGQGRE